MLFLAGQDITHSRRASLAKKEAFYSASFKEHQALHVRTIRYRGSLSSGRCIYIAVLSLSHLVSVHFSFLTMLVWSSWCASFTTFSAYLKFRQHINQRR